MKNGNGKVWQWAMGISIVIIVSILTLMYNSFNGRSSQHGETLSSQGERISRLEAQIQVQFPQIEKRLDIIERKLDALVQAIAISDSRER